MPKETLLSLLQEADLERLVINLDSLGEEKLREHIKETPKRRRADLHKAIFEKVSNNASFPGLS